MSEQTEPTAGETLVTALPLTSKALSGVTPVLVVMGPSKCRIQSVPSLLTLSSVTGVGGGVVSKGVGTADLIRDSPV